jgi:hypothetical protein
VDSLNSNSELQVAKDLYVRRFSVSDNNINSLDLAAGQSADSIAGKYSPRCAALINPSNVMLRNIEKGHCTPVLDYQRLCGVPYKETYE